MSVTINFTASTDTDVAYVKVWEATSSDGAYSLVQTTAITTATTSVTYSSGSESKWYRLSFLDTAGNESALSAAIYGAGYTWLTYMIPLFRVAIEDIATTSTYTDLQLRKKLVIAAAELDREGRIYSIFDYTYTFTIDSGDGSGWLITPDPIYSSADNNFINLWIFRALCSHARSAMIGATSNAIKIKDGDSSIDTTAGFGGYKTLLSAKYGPCESYQSMWRQLIYSSKNDVKNVYANFGTDHIHRVGLRDVYGGIDRSDFSAS